ncbi:hypothetical protein DXG01_000782 [Tephrocybe rancida]|nr:hypothetical protein DXG01_000782 [Tephrocybe rancida]
MSFVGICNVNQLPFNLPMLTQCVVHEMVDTLCQILSTDVIRLLQAATDEDDPTVQVNSYNYDWWNFEKEQNVVLFSTETLTECLNHHWTVTGKAAPKYPTAGKYSPNAVMDIQNELSVHATSALSCTHITLWHAAGLTPPACRFHNAGCNSVHSCQIKTMDPGLTGDGEYLSLQNSASLSPTPALPFKELSMDIINIPLLTPSAYLTHFWLPPLGHGAWVAPKQSMVDPKVAAMLLHVPPPASVTITVADVGGNDRRPPQPGGLYTPPLIPLKVHWSLVELSGLQWTPSGLQLDFSPSQIPEFGLSSPPTIRVESTGVHSTWQDKWTIM